jgi:hypothetical protein
MKEILGEWILIKYLIESLIGIIRIFDFCKVNCKSFIHWLLRKKIKPLPESVATYNQKNMKFNTHIDDILEKIVCVTSPELCERLICVQVSNKNYKIPAISLVKFETNHLNNIIDYNLSKKFDNNVVNTELINFMSTELKRRVYDKPTYRLIDSSTKVKIGISSYFKTLSTSDIHYINFIRKLPLNNETIDWNRYLNEDFLQNWKTHINEILNNNFDNYSASIGCAVLTIIKQKNGEYYFYTKQNSEEKNGGLDGHVSPSFMYQPSNNDYKSQIAEMDLTAQVIREFGEELLNMKKLQAPYLGELENILNGYIQKKKDLKLKQLGELLHNKNSKVQLIATGFVLDIFRLRPEITFLLLIEDDKFLSNLKIRGNWEAKGKQIGLYKLDSYEKFLNRADSVPDLCAPGMSALINGMEYAKKHIFTENTK